MPLRRALALFLCLAAPLARADAPPLTPAQGAFLDRLAAAALARTQPPSPNVTYDPAYVRIPYPNGDVPPGTGVCADVVIRSYRALGIDLQRLVHEDMAAHFSLYPKLWGLKHPDTNIDHRRVPNLRVFFARHGMSIPLTQTVADFHAGDVITLTVPPNLPHIAIVSSQRRPDGVPLVVHNIGQGEVLEDALFTYAMTGHYRFFGRR